MEIQTVDIARTGRVNQKGGREMRITRKRLSDKNIYLTRGEISERALEIAKMCVDDGSYKNAVACIGRMCALEKTIYDSYWKEKYWYGYDLESYFLNSGLKEHPDKDTIVR